MLSHVLHVRLESMNRIGLVVDHSEAAISFAHRVSADDIVSIVLLPGALVVSGAMVLHSVFVCVGNVALLRRVMRVVVLGRVVVHVDVLFDRGQGVRELLHEQDLLQREEGGGHACKQADDEGDLQLKRAIYEEN